MHSMHVHAMIMMWHMGLQTTHGHSWGIAQLRLRHARHVRDVHVPRAARRQRTKGAGAGHWDPGGVPAGTPAAAGHRRWLPPNASGPFNS